MTIGLRSPLRTLVSAHRLVPLRVVRALIARALMLGAFAIVAAPEARANGVPVIVDLAYIDLSNWGPQDAKGSAELIFAEGIVRIDADGLPRLSDSLYQAWLVNSEAGDAVSAGRFNASATGQVAFEGSLPPIADFGFDLLILTVEPDPDTVPQPTEERSIGGYFSLIGVAGLDAVGSDTGAGNALQAPASLPNTGDPMFLTDLIRVGALAMAMGLSVLVGLRLSRRTT